MCLDLGKQSTYFRGGTCHTLLHKSRGLSQGRGVEGVKRGEKQALHTKKTDDRIHFQGCGGGDKLALFVCVCFRYSFTDVKEGKWLWLPAFQSHIRAV